MSRCRMERLVKRSSAFSVPRRKTPVSYIVLLALEQKLIGPDVIVLTSMGEEVAIDAKEAPRS